MAYEGSVALKERDTVSNSNSDRLACAVVIREKVELTLYLRPKDGQSCRALQKRYISRQMRQNKFVGNGLGAHVDTLQYRRPTPSPFSQLQYQDEEKKDKKRREDHRG